MKDVYAASAIRAATTGPKTPTESALAPEERVAEAAAPAALDTIFFEFVYIGVRSRMDCAYEVVPPTVDEGEAWGVETGADEAAGDVAVEAGAEEAPDEAGVDTGPGPVATVPEVEVEAPPVLAVALRQAELPAIQNAITTRISTM